MEPEVLLIGEMIFFFQHERSFLNATKFTLFCNQLLFQMVCDRQGGGVFAGHWGLKNDPRKWGRLCVTICKSKEHGFHSSTKDLLPSPSWLLTESKFCFTKKCFPRKKYKTEISKCHSRIDPWETSLPELLGFSPYINLVFVIAITEWLLLPASLHPSPRGKTSKVGQLKKPGLCRGQFSTVTYNFFSTSAKLQFFSFKINAMSSWGSKSAQLDPSTQPCHPHVTHIVARCPWKKSFQTLALL